MSHKEKNAEGISGSKNGQGKGQESGKDVIFGGMWRDGTCERTSSTWEQEWQKEV